MSFSVRKGGAVYAEERPAASGARTPSHSKRAHQKPKPKPPATKPKPKPKTPAATAYADRIPEWRAAGVDVVQVFSEGGGGCYVQGAPHTRFWVWGRRGRVVFREPV